MSVGDEVFRRIQSAARSAAAKSGTGRAPTQEYLTRHTPEPFLDRLTRTIHAEDFLKGGILLAAYGVRRPMKDADANAVRAEVTTEHLIAVARDIATVDVDDEVVFDLDSISVHDTADRGPTLLGP